MKRSDSPPNRSWNPITSSRSPSPRTRDEMARRTQVWRDEERRQGLTWARNTLDRIANIVGPLDRLDRSNKREAEKIIAENRGRDESRLDERRNRDEELRMERDLENQKKALQKFIDEKRAQEKMYSTKPKARKSDCNAIYEKYVSCMNTSAPQRGGRSPRRSPRAQSGGRRKQRSDNRMTNKKYTHRPSPPFHANDYCGRRKLGNDGHYWVSKPDYRGVCTWKRV